MPTEFPKTCPKVIIQAGYQRRNFRVRKGSYAMPYRLKRATATVLSLMVVCVISMGAGAADKRALVYTALGDSIATGYTLSDTSESYVSLFGKYLGSVPVNLGVNGLDSADMLAGLGKADEITQIKKSDVITVSIGGNDLLELFYKIALQASGSTSSIEQTLQAASTLKDFDSAIAGFGGNWGKIAKSLKADAPDAVIIVNTLINPYQGMVIYGFDFGAFADNYVKKINAAILKDSPGNYLVADSYSAFKNYKGAGKLTNSDLSGMDFDPHPTMLGHSLIFQSCKALKISFNKAALIINGPGNLSVSSSSPNAGARYAASPLIALFEQGSGKVSTIYEITYDTTKQASINPATGEFTAKAPGTVSIKAAVTLDGTNLTCEAVKSIKIVKRQAAFRFPFAMLTIFSAIIAAVIIVVITAGKGRKTRK
jgi:lysophospholipase L1-like esterase